MLKDFGKKISRASQNVVEQTKKTAEIVSIKSKISKIEDEINDMYVKIGKAYYLQYKDNPNDDFIDDFKKLGVFITQKDTYEKRIMELKERTRYPQCGAEVPKNVFFCSACGFRIEYEQKMISIQSNRKCKNCDGELSEEALYCALCGAKNSIEDMDNELQPNQNNVCINCGKILEEDEFFCSQCGEKQTKLQAALDNKDQDENIDAESCSDNKDKRIEVEDEESIEDVDTVENTEKRCINCNELLEEDSIFCSNCGTKNE